MADAVQEQTPPSGPASYSQDGITIDSNTATVQQLRESFETPTPAAESAETATEDTPEKQAPIPPTDPRERNDDGTFKAPEKQKPAKPRDDPNARISQAVGRQREAERRAEEAERRASAHEAELQRLRTAAPVTRDPRADPAQTFADPNDPEPNPDDLTKYPDGQFDRKFYKDQAQWEARQVVKQSEFRAEQGRRSAAHQQAEQTRQRTVAARGAKFSERMDAIIEADPEFISKVHPKLADAWPYSALSPEKRATATFANFLADIVFRSEHPKDLLLHLSNETEVQRLATLQEDEGDAAVIYELANFEARLGAAPLRGSVPQPKISHAKPPIQPLGSSPQTADPSELTDDLDMDEFIRRGNAIDRKAGRL